MAMVYKLPEGKELKHNYYQYICSPKKITHMNITKEETGDLTATIKIEVQEDDYKDSVKKVLKDYQKKANMPGFRPGKVPYGIINKMYGKPVIADEVNKLISDSLNNYLQENKIEILGHPIANSEKTKPIDFEHDKSFSFYFDIGMAPEVGLELSDKIKIDYPDIKVDQKTLDKFLDDIRKRNGTHVHPDTSEEGDIIRGQMTELDKDGNTKENGIEVETSLLTDFIKLKTVKKQFIGLSKDDEVVFNPLKATKNEAETASMLDIKKEELKEHDNDFRFKVTEITRNEPASMGKDLYDKVYPNAGIEDEDRFKERLKEDIKKSLEAESDREFFNRASDMLIEKTDLKLPDEFLKTWLTEHNEKKLTREQIEKDYDEYAKSLKWQLIQNKIIKENDIKVEDSDIKSFIKQYFLNQAPGQEITEEREQQLDGIVEAVMQNKEEVQKISEQLYDQKIKDKIKSTVKLNKKSISYDDFVKLAEEKK